jgi:hypothetical protein
MGMAIYQQAVAKQQRQKSETGGVEKEQAGASGDGLLIPRIARLSNNVAIVLDSARLVSVC